MNKIKSAFIFAVVLCGVAMPSIAMDLSLADATSMIVSESHDIKKADANLKKAEASLDAANANRWFKLDGSMSYMNLVNVEDPTKQKSITLPPSMGGFISESLKDTAVTFDIPDNIFQAGVSLTQPIYTFGKIGNAVKSVQSAIKMADASKEMTLREVKYASAQLYWTAKMTDEVVKLAKQDLANARAAKKSLTSAGRANRSNLLKIESDIASKEINVSDAEFNRNTAHRMLKIMAGINVEEPLNLTDEFPQKFEELNAGELKSTPQWEILAEQVKMYENMAKSKRANAYPTLAATANYSYMTLNENADALFDKRGSQSAYWGLAVQVPLFSGGLNRANATIEAMNAIAAQQDLDQAKKITTEQYNNAIKQYNRLRDNMTTLVKARDLAAQTYKLSQNRFASGQTSAVELADVSAGLYQLDIALLNTKYNILMSAESIKKLGE
jgi:outer membrane protein TolC